jgi:hypothetical protein
VRGIGVVGEMWEKEIVEGGFSLVSPIPLDHHLFSSIPRPGSPPLGWVWLGGRRSTKKWHAQMKTGFGGRG